MCLYSELIDNPKYKKNNKNGGIIPPFPDKRVLLIPKKCGNCMECKKQYANDWNIRLQEEIKTHHNGKFITLTFSDNSIDKLNELIKIDIKHNKVDYAGIEIEHLEKWEKKKIMMPKGYALDNTIATKGMRLFLERWRKKTQKSIHHWTITELGHNGTKNIHLHGVIWSNYDLEEIEQKWQYGYIHKGERKNDTYINYVNAGTINYMTKYVTKVDLENRYYKPIILTSPGIGKGYINTYNAYQNRYRGEETDERYITDTGIIMTLPQYYRQKIYTEEQLEKLWLMKLNKEVRYVMGEKTTNEEDYWKLINEYRYKNKELGYNDNKINYDEKEYKNKLRQLQIETRINKAYAKTLSQHKEIKIKKSNGNVYKEQC